jgi:hypothetical protein
MFCGLRVEIHKDFNDFDAWHRSWHRSMILMPGTVHIAEIDPPYWDDTSDPPHLED